MAKDTNDELKKLVKGLIASKGMTMGDVAQKMGITIVALSLRLSKPSIKMTSFKEILNAIGEDLVIITKDGNKYEVKL